MNIHRISRLLALPTLLVALLLVGCSDSSQQPAQTSTAPVNATASLTMSIVGMHCDGCSMSVTKTLKETVGVATASCTFESKQATIDYDPTLVQPEALLAVVDKMGYTTSIAEVPSAATESVPAAVTPTE